MKLNTPDGFAGPNIGPLSPLTTSICSYSSMAEGVVTAKPMPSLKSFCMLLPCMPRVSGRSTSGPCISWNITSGRYFAACLKFRDCVSSMSWREITLTV
jgi:hypothetical protein